MLILTTKDNYCYKHIQEMKMEVEDIEAGKSANIKNNILIEKNIIPQYTSLMRKYLSV